MAQILGTAGADRWQLTGVAGNIVYGFGGNDLFSDSIGNDWMRGGGGSDVFISTAGSDIMFGGGGDDEFQLLSADANVMIRGGAGFDKLVLDFDLLWPGEADGLQYVYDGALFALVGPDGEMVVLDIKGIEQVLPIEGSSDAGL